MFTRSKNTIPTRLSLAILAVSVAAMTGCADNSNDNSGFTDLSYNDKSSSVNVAEPIAPQEDVPMKLIFQEQSNGKYLLDSMEPVVGIKMQPGQMLMVKRDINGFETVITESEISTLVKEEEEKVLAGTSELTQPVDVPAPTDQTATAQASAPTTQSEGLSFGGAMVASMVGSTMGSMLGNSLSSNLSGNRDFERRQTSFVSPAATSAATRYGYAPRYSGNSTLGRSVTTARSKSTVFRSKPKTTRSTSTPKTSKPRSFFGSKSRSSGSRSSGSRSFGSRGG